MEQLPQLPAEQNTAPAEEKAQEIEENVLAAFSSQTMETQAEEPQAPEMPPEPEYPAGDPFAAEEPEVSEPTRRINLSDLKFGRNYKGDE